MSPIYLVSGASAGLALVYGAAFAGQAASGPKSLIKTGAVLGLSIMGWLWGHRSG